MRAKHKNRSVRPRNPCLRLSASKIRSRSRGATARRLTASSPAIPPRQRPTCFRAPMAASNPAYGKPSPENGASSSRRASSAISWRVSSWSPAMTARSRTFRAGDAFVSPAGFTGTWEIVEPAKKFYAYYE